VSSRSLFQHALSGLLLSTALWLALAARSAPGRIVYMALPLALAFTVRPTNIVSVAVLTVYVAVHYRAWLWRYLVVALPVAIAFFAYNLTVRHSLLPLYYSTPPQNYPMIDGLVQHLLSPSHGLLVFTPICLFSLAGIVLAFRRKWCFPLAPYLVAVMILHSVVIAPVWEGHCYGPRYYADIGHLFMLFLIPAILYWREELPASRRTAWAAVFLTLAVWGVLVHGRGATSVAPQMWSAIPANVDPVYRVWDWSDPPFLRGLH
jgi:hypothetical protein